MVNSLIDLTLPIIESRARSLNNNAVVMPEVSIVPARNSEDFRSVPSANLPLGNRSEEQPPSNSGCLATIRRILGSCIEVKLQKIPPSPRTRQNAASENPVDHQSVNLKPIRLPAVLERDDLRLEQLGNDKMFIKCIVHCSVPAKIICVFGKGKDSELIQSISPGINQKMEIPIKLKSGSKHHNLTIKLPAAGGIKTSPQQINKITVYSTEEKAAEQFEMHITQTVKIRSKEYEFLEVYDQPSDLIKTLQTDRGIAESSVAENCDCVICLSNARNTFLLPCRHMTACGECGEALRRGEVPACPICRTLITNTITILHQGKSESGTLTVKEQQSKISSVGL